LDRKSVAEVGGHLIIDQTEAMPTIDVNTGAFVGHRNLEETISQPISRRRDHRAAAASATGRHHHHDFLDMEEPSTAGKSSKRWNAR